MSDNPAASFSNALMPVGRLRKSYAEPTIRELLFDALAEAGHPLTHLPSGAKGGNRRWKHLDDTTVCWEGFTQQPYHYHVVSYDTMTACVRNGMTFSEDSGLLWVYAKPKRVKAAPRATP